MARRAVPPSTAELRFREQVSNRFWEEIERRHGGCVRKAALELKISPPALHNYLKQRQTIGIRLLNHVCDCWGLSVTAEGAIVRTGKKNASKRSVAAPVQQSIFEALQALSDENVAIRINRKGPNSVTFTLAVKFPNSG